MPEPAVFRHRPTKVEAMRVGDWAFSVIAEWCGGTVLRDGRKAAGILVPTVHGNAIARVGEWVAYSPDRGDFWPVDDVTFSASYQLDDSQGGEA